MPVADFAQDVQRSFPMVGQSLSSAQGKDAPKTQLAQSATSSAQPAALSDKSFWDNVLDVINPLQHLPAVGTLYRQATGDKMGDLEKAAGDTLYGGPIGLASSLADAAFEKITGKDFGDTVLDFVEGGDKTTVTASTTKPLKPLPTRTTLAGDAPPTALAPTSIAKPASPKPAAADVKQAGDANAQALMASIGQSGVDSDLGMRALFAYQKSMGLSAAAPDGLSPAP
jgi:hypothetical protein